MVFSLFVAIVILLLLPGALHADDGFKVYTLGEAVVRSAKDRKQKTGVSYRITYDDIEKADAHTVSEALKYATGVYKIYRDRCRGQGYKHHNEETIGKTVSSFIGELRIVSFSAKGTRGSYLYVGDVKLFRLM